MKNIFLATLLAVLTACAPVDQRSPERVELSEASELNSTYEKKYYTPDRDVLFRARTYVIKSVNSQKCYEVIITSTGPRAHAGQGYGFMGISPFDSCPTMIKLMDRPENLDALFRHYPPEVLVYEFITESETAGR